MHLRAVRAALDTRRARGAAALHPTELPQRVLEQAGAEGGGAGGPAEEVEESEERMKRPKVKSAVIVQLLLAEMTAMRKEMVRLRRMLKELVG